MREREFDGTGILTVAHAAPLQCSVVRRSWRRRIGKVVYMYNEGDAGVDDKDWIAGNWRRMQW